MLGHGPKTVEAAFRKVHALKQVRQRITDADFYRTYVTLRSIRGFPTTTAPGKRRVRVIAALFSTPLPG
jgi:hypothetical protein